MLLDHEIPAMKAAVDYLTGEDVKVDHTGFDVAVLKSVYHNDYWENVLRVLMLSDRINDATGVPLSDRTTQWANLPSVVDRVGREYIEAVYKSLHEEVHAISLSDLDVLDANHNRNARALKLQRENSP